MNGNWREALCALSMSVVGFGGWAYIDRERSELAFRYDTPVMHAVTATGGAAGQRFEDTLAFAFEVADVACTVLPLGGALGLILFAWLMIPGRPPTAEPIGTPLAGETREP